ncbi:hypothetical protein ACHAXT_000278 [Thalassiosira profunda]
MLPSPARLAELAAILKKATTCRACSRGPSSASPCKTASVQDGQAPVPGPGYAGQLLASPPCGHAFCGECWAGASSTGAAAVQSGLQQAAKCPVCGGAVHLPPRPVVPSLPLGESNEGEHAEGQNENAGHTSRGGMASEDLGLGQTQLPPESAEPLRALLGMLRQLRGADVPTNAENDAAGIGTHILQRRMSGAGAHAEADPEQETEVPGTCLPALQNGACGNDAGESEDVKGASAQRSEVAETPTVQESQLSSHKSGVKKAAVAETPTVHESQVSSLRLSSIKSGVKRTGNAHFGESEGNEETEVPGTYLSPLCAKLDGGQYEGKPFQAGPKTPEETEVNMESLPQDSGLRRDKKNCNSETLQPSVEGAKKTSEPVAFSPVKESETAAPGTNLPLLHGNSPVRPQPLGTMDPFAGSPGSAALKWRRITASPDKMRSPRSPLPSLGKRPRGNNDPTPLRHKDAIATDIRPWNIESAPAMSPLTCDVKTCRVGRPLDSSPLHSVRKNLLVAPTQKRTLYLAFDVLDSLEMQALRMLHSQGCCKVVCGGIQQIEGSKRPFPAILVTHSVNQPGFGSQEKGATCDRSYSYLKAKALGARVVDARWLLDSQNAGGMLDWASYEVWGDLESYHSLSSAERCARHGGAPMPSNKFHGVTFGFLRAERRCRLLEDLFEDDTQLVTSQLAQTRPMTTPEVESLVQCWGGRITEDLVHMDMLLVDDSMTVDDIANRLKHHMSHWAIEMWTEDELSAIVHDGALNTVRIPIVRTKWLAQTRPMTTPEVESLVQCWGGRITEDLVHMDMLLVDDSMTVDDIANRLKHHMSHWAIEMWTEDELSAIVHDGALNTVRIPIVRTKWGKFEGNALEKSCSRPLNAKAYPPPPPTFTLHPHSPTPLLAMASGAIPAALRRRRRKKNVARPLSSVSSDLQDAQLEDEIDAYLQRDSAPTPKKHRRAYGEGAGNDVVEGNLNSDDVNDSRWMKCSRALPMLLHLREAGLTRRFSHKNERDTWESLMLHRAVSDTSKEGGDGATNERQSALARLRIPVHPSSASNAQHGLQYSAPTYYGTANKEGSNINGNNLHDNNIQLQRQCWRHYTRQSIPFSELKTPHIDAILAVDRWGSYLIGVGGGEEMGDSSGIRPHLNLAIKFYGVPSPSRLRAQDKSPSCARAQIVSPLLHTVPLLLKKPGSVENRNFSAPPSILGHNEHASPAAETPIQILLSGGGSLGVAFLHHSTAAAWSNNNGSTFSQSPALQDQDTLGTIVIFEPPRDGLGDRSPRLTKSFHCSNVRVGGWKGFTMRNALWPTSLIPKEMSGKSSGVEPSLFSNTCFQRVLDAYMLLNDEDDGYRITWIQVGSGVSKGGLHSAFINSPNAVRPTRSDIVEPTESNVWEEVVSETDTGHCFSERRAEHGLHIEHEVYLHVDALLSDILSRRQSSLFKGSPYQSERVSFMPDFHYNLVRVSPDDLKVLLAVVFSNKEKQIQSTKKVPAALGVFVEISLFDQSYEELKWVQHPSAKHASDMKQWCHNLALNWRMRECRVGIFCLESCKIGPQLEQWVGRTHEVNVDEDLRDDSNVDLWSDFLDRRAAARKKGCAVPPPPKDISMSSLYPFCDVITNRAVHNAIPVKRIASRNSPVELIYG